MEVAVIMKMLPVKATKYKTKNREVKEGKLNYSFGMDLESERI